MTPDVYTCVWSEFFYSLSSVSFLSLQTLKWISSRPCIPRNLVSLEIEIEPLWKSAQNSFYHHITTNKHDTSWSLFMSIKIFENIFESLSNVCRVNNNLVLFHIRMRCCWDYSPPTSNINGSWFKNSSFASHCWTHQFLWTKAAFSAVETFGTVLDHPASCYW